MVDKFRNDFFDNMIKKEKEKERSLQLLQKNCFHVYIIENSYKICKKCNHIASNYRVK